MSFVLVQPLLIGSTADAQFDLPFGDVFYESSNFAAGGSGLLNQQLLNERARGIAIENQKQLLLAEREAMLNQRHLQANAWLRMELDAMQRIDLDQRQQESDLKQSIQGLRKTRNALQSVTTCRDGSCLVSLLSQGLGYCQDRAEVERIMMISVPPLTTDSFRLPARLQLGILDRAGRFRRPPSVLFEDCVDSPMTAVFCQVKARLAQARDSLESKGYLRLSDIQSLQDAFSAWRRALDQLPCPEADRVRGRVYLRQCDRFLAVVRDPRGCSIVRNQLAGNRFNGGTVQDLLVFMDDRHLTASGGGAAQRVLRPLAAEVASQLTARIHRLEEEYENTRSQSIAHQGTLKDWLLQGD